MRPQLQIAKTLLTSPIARNSLLALVALVTSLAVIGMVYHRGYSAGYDSAEIKHMEQERLMLEAHNKMENSLQSLAKTLIEKDSEVLKKYEANNKEVLKRLGSIKLTTVDCNPSKEFIGGWNEIIENTNTANSSK